MFSLYLLALWPAEALLGRQASKAFWTRFRRILIIFVRGCEDAFSVIDPLTFLMPQFPLHAFCDEEIIPLTRCIKKHLEFCF